MNEAALQNLLERALQFALETVQMVADGDLDADESELPDVLIALTSEQAAELRAYATRLTGRPL